MPSENAVIVYIRPIYLIHLICPLVFTDNKHLLGTKMSLQLSDLMACISITVPGTKSNSFRCYVDLMELASTRR